MNFNFTNWHLVPEDATIPAGTPFWRYDPGDDTGRYFGQGVDYDLGLAERWSDEDYYTKEPILPPAEAALEQRARNMYYLTGGVGWEYESLATTEKWRKLAARYIEKEVDK